MLTRTFVHVPGIGERRERALWEDGYLDWPAFLRGYPSGAWRDLIASRLDAETAARDLPRREAWRLATAFPGRTAFLDIETEGLDPRRDAVTCVGLSDGTTVEAFVRGESLDSLPEALSRYDLLVTYNGTGFDLPVLQRAFPQVDFRRFHHIDLRWPLHRLGIKGGLKAAERQLGVARSAEIEGADGFMAVLLWRAHGAGRSGALETLLRYCLEDVVHLKPILARVFNDLAGRLPVPVEPITDAAEPEIPYRADAALVQDLLRETVAWSRPWS